MTDKTVWSLRIASRFVLAIIAFVFVYYTLFQSDGLAQSYHKKWRHLCDVLDQLEQTDAEIDLKSVIIRNKQLGFKLYSPGDNLRGRCFVVTSKYRANSITIENGTPLLIVFMRGPTNGEYMILVYRHGASIGTFGAISEGNVRFLDEIVDQNVVKKWLSRSSDLDDVIMKHRSGERSMRDANAAKNDSPH